MAQQPLEEVDATLLLHQTECSHQCRDDGDPAQGGHSNTVGHRRTDAQSEYSIDEPTPALGHTHRPVETQEAEEAREDRVDEEVRLLNGHHRQRIEQCCQQTATPVEEPAPEEVEQQN